MPFADTHLRASNLRNTAQAQIRQTRLEQPVDVAVGPDGVLYVADLRDRIVKLDPSSDTIEKSWPVHVGRALGGANLTFGGRFLYLTDPDRSVLYSIDTENGRIETLRAGSGADLEAAVRRAGVGPLRHRARNARLRQIPSLPRRASS